MSRETIARSSDAAEEAQDCVREVQAVMRDPRFGLCLVALLSGSGGQEYAERVALDGFTPNGEDGDREL